MLRVLIILDEYQELVYMQSLLSKVGFDVETSQSDMALSGLMMGFRPDLLITTAKGRKINGIKLVLDLRKKKPNLKFLFIRYPKQDLVKLLEDKVIEAYVDSPIDPKDLIHKLANLGGLDSSELEEKLKKITSGSNKLKDDETSESKYVASHQPESQMITGKVKEYEPVGPSTQKNPTNSSPLDSSIDEKEREQRYQNFLKNMEPLPEQSSFEGKRIRDFNKKLRSKPDMQESEDIRILKQKFASNLLKKKN